jgi:hypothetical protein
LHRLIRDLGELLFADGFGEVATTGFKHPPHGAVLKFIGVKLSVPVPIQPVEEIVGIETSPASKASSRRSPGALGVGGGDVTGDTNRTCCPE